MKDHHINIFYSRKRCASLRAPVSGRVLSFTNIIPMTKPFTSWSNTAIPK